MTDFSDSELYEATYGYKEQRSTRRFLLGILLVFLVLLGIRLYIANAFVGVIVDGPSMNTTLYHGEQLLMRLADENRKPERGDVIVVDVSGYDECKGVESGFIIKRLIATEGDKVYCEQGVLYICYAGETTFQIYDDIHAYYPSAQAKQSYGFEVYELQKGEVFFLGDNRTNSKDSRYKEGHSSLKDRLYKAEDIYGIVPQWAIDNQKTLEWIFFPKEIFKK